MPRLRARFSCRSYLLLIIISTISLFSLLYLYSTHAKVFIKYHINDISPSNPCGKPTSLRRKNATHHPTFDRKITPAWAGEEGGGGQPDFYPTPPCAWKGYNSSLLLGVMTTAPKTHTRSIIRKTYALDTRFSTRIIFVIGQPSSPEESSSLAREFREHGDILILPIPENGDQGKTFTFFSTTSRLFTSCPFSFIGKIDDDAWYHIPHLQSHLDSIPPSPFGIYYGPLLTHNPPSGEPPYQYMGGMLTILSHNIVEWISTNPFASTHSIGPEDWMTGAWIQEYGYQNQALHKASRQSPYSFSNSKCPSAPYFPTFVCVNRRDAKDLSVLTGGIRGFNRKSVVVVHKMKIWWELCVADDVLGGD